ncbi:unnamed protein product [Acanthoscelides obtectus]|uniref:folate gamma-glutamyl hydrolase n=2 Tax=Acanthoscelides obtectus TaxID=200917 RepID=A0A9P0PMB5_ACAOB|nr:unnamed protein product [Acanthoscelides obtectus]CAK1649713.1 Gamma-glutamyl hydrolase [Acanthoscelides obtectus]
MLRLLILTGLILSSYASKTPIIGVLSQETSRSRNDIGEFQHSYIAASYVKFLESAGARVIPVCLDSRDVQYDPIFRSINTVLFPGGAAYFKERGGYGEAARKLYNLAKAVNEKGTYYPIIGVCLGHEVLPYADKGDDIRTDCELKNVAVPLKLAADYEKSKMFSKAPDEIISILKTKNVTYNFHQCCLTEKTFRRHKLLPEWKITSTDEDINGIEFISSMENTRYPFYGTQFHPEKNLFEFKAGIGIPHSVEAVKISQYFANFFVEECRKNANRFPDHDLEKRTLIYNYQPIYTGINGSVYEQKYVFAKSDSEKSEL